MDRSFTTMKMDQINQRSLYLKRLFETLPQRSLEEVLLAPREDFVRHVKKKVRCVIEED